MSYRSVKRVLGETHLEWKCLLYFGGLALVFTGASFWFYGWQTEKLVYKQSGQRARPNAELIITVEHFKAQLRHNQNFAIVADAFAKDVRNEVSTYEKLWPDRTRQLPDGTRQLPDGTKVHPDGTKERGLPLDEYDLQVLQRFAGANPDLPDDRVESVERQLPERNQYHYYQTVRFKSNCLTCHQPGLASPTGAKGDLAYVLKVTSSDALMKADLWWNRAILVSTAIGTAFFLVVFSYLIIRYVIAKPVKHLQDVSEAISRGEMDQRAEIQTRDEFEALGNAFNKMVRHLVDLQAEAKQANSELDRKVDELAQTNMRLYEMNRLKSDFLATVSHELRTPLNSIIGFSDVLASLNGLGEKHVRYLQNIQTSGKMLLEMINDILDLAKIEAGKMEIRPGDFRIDYVLHEQCDLARPLVEKKNLDLVVEVRPGLPELHQDQKKVQQILNNLLSNAIKFTPDGGRIVVRAEPAGPGYFHMVVADTGVGIAEADRTKIFEKFRQGAAAGDAMTREHSGTGLGLSIVKELCKLLGGEIMLESELGKGSTFTARLPIQLPDQPEVDALQLAAATDGFTSSRRELSRSGFKSVGQAPA
jgi:signal transduction histidine kinase